MGLLRKFFGLSRLEQTLFLETSFLFSIIKLELLLFPSVLVKSHVQNPPQARAQPNGATLRQLVWAVIAAGRFVPGGKGCLPQALVAEILLKRHGFPVELKIGVARAAGRGFQAHAWVENQGEILVGRAEAPRYKVLLAKEAGE